ncbi:MAG: thiamine pyrophosphate-binding protein [Actinomycetota bacterium]
MATMTGREQFFEVARSEGIRHLFANPGTTELPIFDELAGDTGIELVLALQEATAVAAADGFAQASRTPALVNLHIAPGVANGLGNIFNAYWSRSPIVVTAGQQNINQLIQDPMLAADLVRMVDQFCKWSYEVRRPEDIGVAMRRAFKIAMTPPTGPVFLSIPWNHLDESVETVVPPRSRIDHGAAPGVEVLREAATRLLAAEQPIIIAGDEVARAGAVADLVELAEAVGARVVGEMLHGRMVFPMDHPLWNGGLMPMNAAVRAALERGDLLLACGAQMFPVFFFNPVSPIPEGVEVIQIDSDPYEIAKTYPVALGLRGDVGATIRGIVREVRSLLSAEDTARRQARAAGYAAERQGALAGLDAAVEQQITQTPLPTLGALAAVVRGFDDNRMSVVDESVSATAALRGLLRLRDPDSYFFFRGGGLGWGIPASAGVALAQPDRKVVAVVGDGATCYVPQALWTLAHYDIPSTVVVLNNGGYYIIKAQMQGMGGKSAAAGVFPGTEFSKPSVDFVGLANAFGVPAERAEKAGDVEALVRRGIASGGPSLIEVPVFAGS